MGELKSEREPGFESRQPVLNSSLDSNHKCNVSFYLDVVTIVHFEKMQTTVVLQLPHLLCLQNPFLCFTVFCRSVVFFLRVFELYVNDYYNTRFVNNLHLALTQNKAVSY